MKGRAVGEDLGELLPVPFSYLLYPSASLAYSRTTRVCLHPQLALSLWPGLKTMALSICVESQFSSVTQSCPTLCDPMNCSTPGLPVIHQLPEFTQTHVHCGEGNGNPLQCSCLENPRDRGAWWAALYGVTQGRT